MGLPVMQPIELRSHKRYLTAWVGDKLLGIADVSGDKILITVSMRQAVQDVVIPAIGVPEDAE